MDNLLAGVQQWCSAKLASRELRPIDVELPNVLARLAPEENALMHLLCVLVSHQYGRGHSCLRLSAICHNASEQLGIAAEVSLLAEAQATLSIQPWLQPAALAKALANSPWVTPAKAGEQQVSTPLVWADNRLYLARLWVAEQQVAAAIGSRVAHHMEQSLAHLPSLIQQVFAGEQQAQPNQVHWQSVACAMAAQRQFTIITGGPGTGKTTTVVRLLAILLNSASADLRIRLAAPTGKAAARLTESIAGAINRLPSGLQSGIPTEVVTLHKLLGARPLRRSFKHSAAQPLDADVVVVDEASMVDLEMMAALMAALPAHAKLILLGDKDQLASVEAGSVLGDLCRNAELGLYQPDSLALLQPYAPAALQEYAASAYPDQQPSLYNQATVMLRQSHRFGASSGIGNLARAVNLGDSKVLALFQQFNDIHLLEAAEPSVAALRQLLVAGYRPFLQLAKQTTDIANRNEWALSVLKQHRAFQLLVALRNGNWGVNGLNEQIAEWLLQDKLISRNKGWYAGRPVLVQRNNYTLGLMNGDIGITLFDPLSGKLRVVFEQADGSVKWVLPSRLSEVETVFALTVHKSQGSEFSHTVLALPAEMNPIITRELVYTGITRASEKFTLVTPRQAIFTAAIQQRVIRSSGL